MPEHRSGREKRLRRRLLGVLLCDASACSALILAALSNRGKPSAAVFASIAQVAVTSLIPGAIAVGLERHLHRYPRREPHRMTAAVLLFSAGMAINTAGTVHILLRARGPESRRPDGVAVDVALLIGGNAIGVPYLALVRGLHRIQASA